MIAGKLEKDIGNRLTVCGAVVATSKNASSAQAFLDLLDSRLCEIYKRAGIYLTD